MTSPGKYRSTPEEVKRARLNPHVQEAWACALRAGVTRQEIRESSILREEDGTLPGLEQVEYDSLVQFRRVAG